MASWWDTIRGWFGWKPEPPEPQPTPTPPPDPGPVIGAPRPSPTPTPPPSGPVPPEVLPEPPIVSPPPAPRPPTGPIVGGTIPPEVLPEPTPPPTPVDPVPPVGPGAPAPMPPVDGPSDPTGPIGSGPSVTPAPVDPSPPPTAPPAPILPAAQDRLPYGAPLDEENLNEIADGLGIPLSKLWTVISVETRGYGFWRNGEPAILFERHKFSSATEGRFDATASDISNPSAGGYGPSSVQYDRIRRAAMLDYDAALESASWGLGQVMGFNAVYVGYPNVRDFVEKMRRSENDHVRAMAGFIRRENLERALQQEDWAFFARRYNGPRYRDNRYDEKLAAAYARFSDARRMPDWKVREAQFYLVYLDIIGARGSSVAPDGVDGMIGPQTRGAITEFFRRYGPPFDASGLWTVPDDILARIREEALKRPAAWPLEGLGGGGGFVS